MAKLFRKGRFQFFKGKGWGQYLLYILLEMLLVVAGILIALEINNGNENQKREDRALAILEEVRRDLRANLQSMENIQEVLELKDSLLTRVISDSVSAEDYRKDFSYAGLIMTYVSMNFQNNGFQSMGRQSEYFSRDRDSLFTELTELYEDRYGVIETMQERLGDHVIHNLERWSQEKPWFYKLSSGRLTEEAVTFFAEDPLYRNMVEVYRTYASVNVLPALRDARLHTSRAIAHLNLVLEPETDAYAEFAGYLIPTNLGHWAQDTGTYLFMGQILFELSIEEGNIIFNQAGQISFPLYPQNDSTLFLPRLDRRVVVHRGRQELSLEGGPTVQTLSRKP